MRGLWLVAAVAACGSSEPASPDLVMSLSFPATDTFGTNPSYLQKYVNQMISLEITLTSAGFFNEPAVACGETTAYEEVATRVALGGNGPDFQRELLDPIDRWDLELEICDDPSQSTVSLVGAIDPINLSFGCGVIPAEAQQRAADGSAVITSFTATSCNAIVLDVINAFSIGNTGFSMTVETGPDRLP